MMGSPNRTSAWLTFAQRSRDEGGLGLAPHQAAGIVGNLVHESGQDLNPWGPTGDNGTAWGTAQWRGDRLARLKARPDYQTLEGQQAFMREELDGSENKAYRALLAAKTAEEAAHAWDAHYERSDGSTRAQRMQSARALMDQFGEGAADTSAMSYAPTERKSMPALSADSVMGPGILNMGAGAEGGADVIGRGLTGMGAALAGISSPEQGKALTALQASMMKAPGNKWSVAHVDPKTGQALLTNGQSFVPWKAFQPKPDDDTYTEETKKSQAKSDVERFNEIQSALPSLDEQIAKAKALRKAAENPKVTFGGGGNLTADAKNIAYSLGIPIEGLDDTQTVQRIGTGFQLDNGKKLPGSVSNYEDKLMGVANGLGLDKTRESNLTAIDAKIAAYEHQKALGAEARKYAAAHGGVLDSGWFEHAARWSQENPFVMPAPVTAPQKPSAVTIEPGGNYVWTPQGMRKK